MNKKIVSIFAGLLALGFLADFVFAGGVDNKQNYSANYAGTVSRNAAIDGTDIAAYNPAGIMQLENGMHLGLDVQFLSLDYDHHISGKDYETTSNPIVPALFSIYKQDKWAAYGSFTIVGGGGKVEYDEGNIITKTIGNVAAAGAFRPLLPAGGILHNEFAAAESYDYGFTTGLSYKINDIFSVSGAARYVTTDKTVDIHGTYLQGGTNTYILGKYEQEADGFGGVIGLNIRPNDTFNIALRYESRVKLDWETTIDSATKGTVGEAILIANKREDGKSYRRDLPAVLAAGFQWNVTPKFSISPSYTLYLEKDADWGTQNDRVDNNSYDLAISLGYAFTENIKGTMGYMYTDVGMTPDNFSLIEQMSPALDCHTVAVGGSYTFNKRISVTTGLMGSFYQSGDAGATSLAPGVQRAPAVTYEKTVYTLAINLQYHFF
ncbi:MAG: outer membrane protein transport protein [Proteobacteria bacterium]|nr:outer membrane protein transport protein [Pseudomonadota bacterium]